MEALSPLLSAEPLVLALIAVVLLVWRMVHRTPARGGGGEMAHLEGAVQELRSTVSGHERQFAEHRGLGARMAAVESAMVAQGERMTAFEKAMSQQNSTLEDVKDNTNMIIKHLLEQRRV